MNPVPSQLTMVNDRFVDQLDVRDRGLAFGDGLFETMRLQGGHIPLLSLHLDRIASGCERLSIPLDRSHLVDGSRRFIAAHESPASAVIKLIVTRGIGGHGYRPPSAESTIPTIIWQSLPLVDMTHLSRDGVSLVLCPLPVYPNPYLAGLKHLNRLHYVMAARDLPACPEVQGLLVDESEILIETIHHNLFLVKNGRLITPDLSRSGVCGVLRRLILEQLAPSQSIPCEETEVSLDVLQFADEVFITNGVRGIWPVRLFQSKCWDVPGPVTQILQRCVQRVMAEPADRGIGE